MAENPNQRILSASNAAIVEMKLYDGVVLPDRTPEPITDCFRQRAQRIGMLLGQAAIASTQLSKELQRIRVAVLVGIILQRRSVLVREGAREFLGKIDQSLGSVFQRTIADGRDVAESSEQIVLSALPLLRDRRLGDQPRLFGPDNIEASFGRLRLDLQKDLIEVFAGGNRLKDVNRPRRTRHLFEGLDNPASEVYEGGRHRKRAEIGHPLHEVFVPALAVCQAVALRCSTTT
jgi:hypothetical protein